MANESSEQVEGRPLARKDRTRSGRRLWSVANHGRGQAGRDAGGGRGVRRADPRHERPRRRHPRFAPTRTTLRKLLKGELNPFIASMRRQARTRRRPRLRHARDPGPAGWIAVRRRQRTKRSCHDARHGLASWTAARSWSAIGAAISTPRRPTTTACSWKTRASSRKWILTVVRHPPEDAVRRRPGLLQGPVLRGGDDRDGLRRLAPVGDPPALRHRRLRGDDRDREPRQGAGRGGRQPRGRLRLRRSVRGQGQAGEGRRAVPQRHRRQADARLQARHLRARDDHQGRQEGRDPGGRLHVQGEDPAPSRPGP